MHKTRCFPLPGSQVQQFYQEFACLPKFEVVEICEDSPDLVRWNAMRQADLVDPRHNVKGPKDRIAAMCLHWWLGRRRNGTAEGPELLVFSVDFSFFKSVKVPKLCEDHPDLLRWDPEGSGRVTKAPLSEADRHAKTLKEYELRWLNYKAPSPATLQDEEARLVGFCLRYWLVHHERAKTMKGANLSSFFSKFPALPRMEAIAICEANPDRVLWTPLERGTFQVVRPDYPYDEAAVAAECLAYYIRNEKGGMPGGNISKFYKDFPLLPRFEVTQLCERCGHLLKWSHSSGRVQRVPPVLKSATSKIDAVRLPSLVEQVQAVNAFTAQIAQDGFVWSTTIPLPVTLYDEEVLLAGRCLRYWMQEEGMDVMKGTGLGLFFDAFPGLPRMKGRIICEANPDLLCWIPGEQGTIEVMFGMFPEDQEEVIAECLAYYIRDDTGGMEGTRIVQFYDEFPYFPKVKAPRLAEDFPDLLRWTPGGSGRIERVRPVPKAAPKAAAPVEADTKDVLDKKAAAKKKEEQMAALEAAKAAAAAKQAPVYEKLLDMAWAFRTFILKQGGQLKGMSVSQFWEDFPEQRVARDRVQKATGGVFKMAQLCAAFPSLLRCQPAKNGPAIYSAVGSHTMKAPAGLSQAAASSAAAAPSATAGGGDDKNRLVAEMLFDWVQDKGGSILGTHLPAFFKEYPRLPTVKGPKLCEDNPDLLTWSFGGCGEIRIVKGKGKGKGKDKGKEKGGKAGPVIEKGKGKAAGKMGKDAPPDDKGKGKGKGKDIDKGKGKGKGKEEQGKGGGGKDPWLDADPWGGKGQPPPQAGAQTQGQAAPGSDKDPWLSSDPWGGQGQPPSKAVPTAGPSASPSPSASASAAGAAASESQDPWAKNDPWGGQGMPLSKGSSAPSAAAEAVDPLMRDDPWASKLKQQTDDARSYSSYSNLNAEESKGNNYAGYSNESQSGYQNNSNSNKNNNNSSINYASSNYSTAMDTRAETQSVSSAPAAESSYKNAGASWDKAYDDGWQDWWGQDQDGRSWYETADQQQQEDWSAQDQEQRSWYDAAEDWRDQDQQWQNGGEQEANRPRALPKVDLEFAQSLSDEALAEASKLLFAEMTRRFTARLQGAAAAGAAADAEAGGGGDGA